MKIFLHLRRRFFNISDEDSFISQTKIVYVGAGRQPTCASQQLCWRATRDKFRVLRAHWRLPPSCHPLVTLLSPSCHPLVTLLLTSTYPLAPLSLHSTSPLLLVCTIDEFTCCCNHYPLTKPWSILTLRHVCSMMAALTHCTGQSMTSCKGNISTLCAAAWWWHSYW